MAKIKSTEPVTEPAPKANRFGTSNPTPPIPGAQAVIPDLKSLVQKYFGAISAGDVLEKLDPIVDAWRTQGRLADEHSPTQFDRRIDEASIAYSQNPNDETLETLRHLRTLTPQDFARTQYICGQKQREMLHESAPFEVLLHERLLKIINELTEKIIESESPNYAQFGLRYTTSAIVVGLQKLAAQLQGSLNFYKTGKSVHLSEIASFALEIRDSK